MKPENERRLHQCHADGCDSQAEWSTKVVIACPEPGGRRLIATNCSIKVCHRHKEEAKVLAYLRQEQNRYAITVTLMDAGYHEPNFLSMRVEFEPIHATGGMILKTPPVACDRDGCTKVARWQVVQKFRTIDQRGRGSHRVGLLTNICVCDEHKALTRPTDFLDRESEAIIRRALSQREVHLPDLKTMAVDFEAIDGKRLNPRSWVGDDGPASQFKAEGVGKTDPV